VLSLVVPEASPWLKAVELTGSRGMPGKPTKPDLASVSAVGWDHLIRYSDDALHPFGERDQRGSLLGRANESP
jgi:hypothetical protein